MRFNEIKNGMKVKAVDVNYCGYCTVGAVYTVNVTLTRLGKPTGDVELIGKNGQTFCTMRQFLRGFKSF